MTPIICCGETLDQREAGQTDTWVRGQIRAALAGLTEEQVINLLLLMNQFGHRYGKSSTSADANETCAVIRAEVADAVSQKQQTQSYSIRR
nr:triose-phosphate isomerase [Listeria monocytogenes]